MKKINYILAIYMIFSLSCSSENEGYFARHSHVDFAVQNSMKEDLLDTKSNNAIDLSTIKIYYLVGDHKIEYYQYTKQTIPGAILDNTRGFFVTERPGQQGYRLFVYLNETGNTGDLAYTFIEWNAQDTDTIVSKIHKGENSLISSFIAFNDSIVDKTKYPYFTIVK